MTREKRKSIGLRGKSSDREFASGYKLQDATLLSECIATAAVYSNSRKPQLKLQLFQRDCQRGPADSLFLWCPLCKNEAVLKTSRRLGGVGGGAYEVNRRSVLSQKLGQAGLVDFCARMNLPPPVTKKSYNEHLIQIEKAAVEHANIQMQDAAKRLFEKVKSEQPENIVFENEMKLPRLQ